MTTTAINAHAVALRDNSDDGYSELTEPTWVLEDADGCYLSDLELTEPANGLTNIGHIATALDIPTTDLTPWGYVSGGTGVFLRAEQYRIDRR